jgi:hypothetical protein
METWFTRLLFFVLSIIDVILHHRFEIRPPRRHQETKTSNHISMILPGQLCDATAGRRPTCRAVSNCSEVRYRTKVCDDRGSADGTYKCSRLPALGTETTNFYHLLNGGANIYDRDADKIIPLKRRPMLSMSKLHMHQDSGRRSYISYLCLSEHFLSAELSPFRCSNTTKLIS